MTTSTASSLCLNSLAMFPGKGKGEVGREREGEEKKEGERGWKIGPIYCVYYHPHPTSE